jgi:23S rRNA (cytidine1920-2'-O)/16S rRNA (cytidine1409-2'-O)-methyltransferase
MDVGYGQLAWELRSDARVTVIDRTNVREVRPSLLPYRPSLVTADLSFISLRLAADPLVRVTEPLADLVFLVKPQFEVERDDIERGGVVRDPALWRRAIDEVAAAIGTAGAGSTGVMVSPVKGPAGNVEFLLHARTAAERAALDIDGAIEAAGKLAAS